MNLPKTAIDIIETWRMGFIATVNASGKPNLSPKGTFIVLEGRDLAFGEIRSPNTIANIAAQKEVEVNFVDVLSRRGVRLRGEAEINEKGSDWFQRLLPQFQLLWEPDLVERFNAIVTIKVLSFSQLKSPAYDTGTTEPEFRAIWKDKIGEMSADLTRQ